MLDSPSTDIVLSQLNSLLKVPVLPKGPFTMTCDQNLGPLPEEDEMIRNDEFSKLGQATDSLKNSNTVPQNMEIETIECFQKKCTEDVSRDDHYIQHLQIQINGILEEIQTTRMRQSRIRSLSDFFKPICSPVRRLPLEILVTIFELCLPPNAGPHGGAPLVLCHVSSLWRRVALGSQRLWSSLSLDFVLTSDSKYDEISKFWSQHAMNQPRSLHFYHQHLPGSPHGTLQISEDLTRSSMLLRTLRSIGFCPPTLLPFLRLPSSDVPLLEVVHLVSAEECDEVLTVLEAAPRLHVVQINMFSTLFQGTLPWSQLTWLKIRDPIEAVYWTVVFKQCVRLQYGSFEVLFPSTGNFGSAIQTTLEHLETLCLTVEDHYSLFEGFFQTLALPSLQHFILTNLSFDEYPDMPFFGMIPCPNLSSLCLQGVRVADDEPTAFFSTTPTLTSLALDISILHHSPILESLHRHSGMLPNLSHLYLIISYEDIAQDQREICSTIVSRFPNGFSSLVPLKHVSLFFHRYGSHEYENFEVTLADTLRRMSAIIMSDPNSDGVDLHVKTVPDVFQLADVVEKIWCEWPQDY